MRSCVIVVENLPVPFDRRVWQEACALRDAHWKVTVVCPLTKDYPEKYAVIDGIEIYRHPLPVEANGKFAFLLEYAAALYHEFRLLLKIRKLGPIDVVHACNPPDLIFLAALPFKLAGAKFVFDHHDVSPELYEAKFGSRGLVHSALVFAEWCTFKLADLVISSNETFRQIALDRGGKAADDVVTVYSVPTASRMRRTDPDRSISRGKSLVIGYVGIIGKQDGLDHLVRAVHHLVNTLGERDFQAVVVGDGPALEDIKKLTAELKLEDYITFTGYRSGEELLSTLSAFDIGVIPDPVNPYNDKISMNKVFEYSTLGLPIIAYPLTETKRLLGEAGLFAKGADPVDLANAIHSVMTDPAKREQLAALSAKVAKSDFSWATEASKLVAAYERLLPSQAVAVTDVVVSDQAN